MSPLGIAILQKLDCQMHRHAVVLRSPRLQLVSARDSAETRRYLFELLETRKCTTL